ncbi:hypothetical protein BDR04DRAFT_75652 [Suillus decipiens]|nr:hypothetical protein BDR04DRAFT_75652 [Suillus decipiens]
MACPPHVTTKKLSGKLKLNKTLSDSVDETLKLQDVGYLKRTAINNLPLTLEPSQYTDDDGVEHIVVKQVLTGGFQAPTDHLILNREETFRNDTLFGHLIAKSWRSKVEDLDIDFLKEGWSEDTVEDGLIAGIVKSDTDKTKKDWVIHVVWGFAIIDGVRRFARRFKFTTKERAEPIFVRLYYDYEES